MPIVQTTRPRARERASGVAAAMTASDVGNTAAAPMPEIACPTNSGVIEWVSAVRPVPMVIRNEPMTSSRLRPNRSPSTPKVSSSTTVGSMNASLTQVSWVPEAPSVDWMMPWRGELTTSAVCAKQTAMKHATMVATTGRDEVPALERMATELAMGDLLAQRCRNLVLFDVIASEIRECIAKENKVGRRSPVTACAAVCRFRCHR